MKNSRVTNNNPCDGCDADTMNISRKKLWNVRNNGKRKLGALMMKIIQQPLLWIQQPTETTSDPCEGCDADPISQDKRAECDNNRCYE